LRELYTFDITDQTPFTVSIEAKAGSRQALSAADRVTTVKAAIADLACWCNSQHASRQRQSKLGLVSSNMERGGIPACSAQHLLKDPNLHIASILV